MTVLISNVLLPNTASNERTYVRVMVYYDLNLSSVEKWNR